MSTTKQSLTEMLDKLIDSLQDSQDNLQEFRDFREDARAYFKQYFRWIYGRSIPNCDPNKAKQELNEIQKNLYIMLDIDEETIENWKKGL